MRVQSYQIVSAAMVLATFLLVERPPDPHQIRADIDMVMVDLQSLVSSPSERDTRSVPLVTDGIRVVQRILTLYDSRPTISGRDNRSHRTSDPPTSLAPAISQVFGGGEASAHNYLALERCAIDYIVNDNVAGRDTTINSSLVAHLDGFAWGSPLIDLSSDWEGLLIDLDCVVESAG